MDWKNGNIVMNGMIDVTPFLLFESTGDSEEGMADDVHHHHHHHHHEATAAAMDSAQGTSFQEEEEDDDAQSCSCDHSFYRNYDTHHSNHHELAHGESLIYDHINHDDDHQEEEEEEEDIDIDDDDDDDKNWADSKLVGSNVTTTITGKSRQQKRSSNQSCVDLDLTRNQREYDKRFWEACLAS